MMPIACVIPTFNGRQLLATNLPAVIDMLRDGDQLLIIDDVSQDDSLAFLRSWGKLSEVQPTTQTIDNVQVKKWQGLLVHGHKKIDLTILAPDHNLRFAHAVNLAVTQVKTAQFLLLNNDVAPDEQLISYLQPHFVSSDTQSVPPPTEVQDKGTVFGVGCLEIETDSSREVKMAGKNKLYFKRGMFIHSRADDFESGETAWASGGSGMFDTHKWRALDGFDLNFYPAYWEDIDLSFRARSRGWQILFEARAKVRHVHETTHQKVFGQAKIKQISWQNANYFTRKHASLGQLLSYWLWQPYWLFKMKAHAETN